MQLYPLIPDAMAAAPAPDSDVAEPVIRTFCVVWQTGGPNGPRWKADVVADSAVNAAWSVIYDRDIVQEQILGVIDRSTIR